MSHIALSMRVLSSLFGESKYLRTVYKPHTALSMRVLSSLFGESKYLRTVYKPHSVQQQVPGRSSLWAACRHTARCGLPGTDALPLEGVHMEASSLPPSADDFVPAWPCSRRGLPGHAHYCARRWSFTPPFHPYNPHLPSPIRGRLGRGCGLFLWPFPAGSRLSAVSPPRVLSDAVLFGVRTFLDPDNAGPRSPDRPEVLS
jgi:hypothetical protein